MRLDSGDVFHVVKNAQRAGVLELLPPMSGHIAPGERFFESVQSGLLDKLDLEELDKALYHLAPTIRYMADERHWKPAEFTSDEMFRAVRHLQQMGVFQVSRLRLELPSGGDRYFEHYQAVLIEKIGVENLDRLLHTLGQCIKFLATDAAMVNVKVGMGGNSFV